MWADLDKVMLMKSGEICQCSMVFWQYAVATTRQSQ